MLIGISVYDWVDNCHSAAAGFLYIWRHCSLKHSLNNWEALPYSEFPSIHALQPLKTNINSPNDSPSNIQPYSSSPPQHNHRVFPTSCLWSKKNKRKWQKQKQLHNLYRRPKMVNGFYLLHMLGLIYLYRLPEAMHCILLMGNGCCDWLAVSAWAFGWMSEGDMYLLCLI